jgi:hypothetical protein
MADSKVTDLTALTTLDGAEELYVNDEATDKKVGLDDLYRHASAVHSFRTDAYYVSNQGTTQSTASISADTLYAVPIPIPFNQSINRIGVEVTTLGAGNIRLGIYDSINGIPTNLILDAGTIDCSTTGSKEITIDQTLSGVHFLAFVSDVAPTLRANNNPGGGWTLGTATTSGAAISYYYGSHTYAALPDPFVTITQRLSGKYFRIWLRNV